MSTNNINTANPKYRISLDVPEMETIISHLQAGDALDNFPLIEKFRKTIAKASLDIITPAYVGNTKLPGVATMERIQQQEVASKGAALLSKLHRGESMTDDETYEAMSYLIDVCKEAPTKPEEIAAMDTYMNIKILKSIGG